MAKKSIDIEGLPLPPIPKWMLPATDTEHEDAVLLKPEDIRARLQLGASKALDLLEWHAMNLGDAKASEDACRELLDRAGYVAPAKGKGEAPLPYTGGGSALPPIEDDIKGLSSAFAEMPSRGGEAEVEDNE